MIAHSGLIFWSSSRPQVALLEYAPDYVLHFSAYLLMGLLAVRAFGRGLSPPPASSAVFLAAAFSLAYAASDEVHQSFVPGRVASVQDLVADGLGVLVGITAVMVYWHLRKRPKG